VEGWEGGGWRGGGVEGGGEEQAEQAKQVVQAACEWGS
jgi:hypothetical protein